MFITVKRRQQCAKFICDFVLQLLYYTVTWIAVISKNDAGGFDVCVPDNKPVSDE
jgi:hypothetical protein